jgi:phospholipid/cholesterol/gamma-HCH transport system ATP-binding protein
MANGAPIITIRDLTVGFGRQPVLSGLNLDVLQGEILGVVGGSGAGKSVLLRTIIGLIRPRAGRIQVLGTDLTRARPEARRAIERRWGILFQQGALFSALTALQNVQFPMREFLDLSDRMLTDMAIAKLEMVGLNPDDGNKMPAELSGGMTKRVALARALALDPEIVFLDEPTSGLDPISAGAFDELIRTLQQTHGLYGDARPGQPGRRVRPDRSAGRRQGGGRRNDGAAAGEQPSVGADLYAGAAAFLLFLCLGGEEKT